MASLQKQIETLTRSTMELQAQIQRLREFVGYDDTEPVEDDTLDLPSQLDYKERDGRRDRFYIVSRHPRGRKSKWGWLDAEGEWIEQSAGEAPPKLAISFPSQAEASKFWAGAPFAFADMRKGYVAEVHTGRRPGVRLPSVR